MQQNNNDDPKVGVRNLLLAPMLSASITCTYHPRAMACKCDRIRGCGCARRACALCKNGRAGCCCHCDRTVSGGARDPCSPRSFDKRKPITCGQAGPSDLHLRRRSRHRDASRGERKSRGRARWNCCGCCSPNNTQRGDRCVRNAKRCRSTANLLPRASTAVSTGLSRSCEAHHEVPCTRESHDVRGGATVGCYAQWHVLEHGR